MANKPLACTTATFTEITAVRRIGGYYVLFAARRYIRGTIITGSSVAHGDVPGRSPASTMMIALRHREKFLRNIVPFFPDRR